MLKSANFCNKINKKKMLKWCCEGWRYVAKVGEVAKLLKTTMLIDDPLFTFMVKFNITTGDHQRSYVQPIGLQDLM